MLMMPFAGCLGVDTDRRDDSDSSEDGTTSSLGFPSYFVQTLPTCDASLEGALVFDNSTKLMKTCESGTWTDVTAIIAIAFADVIDNAQGGSEKATYRVTDASGQLTTDTADKLIGLSWSTAPSEGLLWTRLQINVIDNNDQRHACDEATGGTGKCIITQLEAGSGSDAAKDARWNPAEELRIDENGAEIPGCTGDATSCVVKVEVLLDNALLGTIQTVTISD